MNSKVYKCCSVPMCQNTTIKTPQKLFVHVPNAGKIRKLWFQLARRYKPPKSKSVYFCEDHFNLPHDMENYMQYKIMGSVTYIRMISNCTPSKFHCQANTKSQRILDRLQSQVEAENVLTSAQEMSDRTSNPALVKLEGELQEEDVLLLDSPVTLQITFERDIVNYTSQEIDTAQEMPVVVKQEREFQEDVPSLDSPETRQVDVGPLGLLLPVKLEPATDDFIKQEIDIGPTVLYKPVSFPTPILLDTVKYGSTHSDGTVSYGDHNNPAQRLLIKEESKLNLRQNITKKKIYCYSCNICKFKTANQGNLKVHLRTHTGEKPYRCTYCKYTCSLKSNLGQHIRTHTAEKRYSCDVCQYKCSIKSDLIKHIRTHTGEKPYSCTYCQNKFSIKSNLVQHIRTHTAEKRYSCDVCQYKCSIRSDLIKHRRTHTGEKPYNCTYCQYKFSIKSNLVHHMRTHTGEKPYSCSYCQYKCAIKSNLIKHMRTHTLCK